MSIDILVSRKRFEEIKSDFRNIPEEVAEVLELSGHFVLVVRKDSILWIEMPWGSSEVMIFQVSRTTYDNSWPTGFQGIFIRTTVAVISLFAVDFFILNAIYNLTR